MPQPLDGLKCLGTVSSIASRAGLRVNNQTSPKRSWLRSWCITQPSQKVYEGMNMMPFCSVLIRFACFSLMDNWWKRDTCASRNLWLFIPSESAVLGQWLDHNQHSFGNLSLHVIPETCNCTLHPPWNFWVLWVWVSLSLLPCSLNVFHGSLPRPSSFHQSFDYLYN